MSSLRLGADALLFRGRYRLIGLAALIDERFRLDLGISVQARSPSRARAWYPCRREHSLLCRRNDGSDSSHPRLKIVRTSACCPKRGKLFRSRPPHRRTCQFRARIGFAGFLGIAPQETLSGSMRHRKSPAHSRFASDSPRCPKCEGLCGGANRILTLSPVFRLPDDSQLFHSATS